MAEAGRGSEINQRNKLADSLARLFTDISAMVKADLEGTNNQLLLLEKMNERVTREYSGFGDVVSGLRVFVEQLNEKNHGFDDYISQIDVIDRQVADFEAVVSMLDNQSLNSLMEIRTLISRAHIHIFALEALVELLIQDRER
ncbi:Biogenesis of lysosome-related organelles complex 1 subunit 2 [Platanthera zijinensis]|uniref:Biogenesis of lysosome-related organelles complex 1 subunit 2 n=1 Tax=Platanthera zijinensis TaxID=2320716 RepID=A0AAP0BZA1_9ASPA